MDGCWVSTHDRAMMEGWSCSSSPPLSNHHDADWPCSTASCHQGAQQSVSTAGPSLLQVDEGSWACLGGGALGATDQDSPSDLLTFHLEAPPLHGFLENTLPTPGSEKSNAGVPIGVCHCMCVCVCRCVFVCVCYLTLPLPIPRILHSGPPDLRIHQLCPVRQQGGGANGGPAVRQRE